MTQDAAIATTGNSSWPQFGAFGNATDSNSTSTTSSFRQKPEVLYALGAIAAVLLALLLALACKKCRKCCGRSKHEREEDEYINAVTEKRILRANRDRSAEPINCQLESNLE